MTSEGIDESTFPQRDPVERSQSLARLKAEDVASRRKDAWVVGCDTLVVSADGEIFEKPEDEKQACYQISAQSGRTSIVHSGLCLISPTGKTFEGISSSEVRFKKLSAEEIDWWIGKRLWEGRSGSFQIDGLGQLMIEEIKGDWTSIVGFPVFLFGEMSREAGVSFL